MESIYKITPQRYQREAIVTLILTVICDIFSSSFHDKYLTALICHSRVILMTHLRSLAVEGQDALSSVKFGLRDTLSHILAIWITAIYIGGCHKFLSQSNFLQMTKSLTGYFFNNGKFSSCLVSSQYSIFFRQLHQLSSTWIYKSLNPLSLRDSVYLHTQSRLF